MPRGQENSTALPLVISSCLLVVCLLAQQQQQQRALLDEAKVPTRARTKRVASQTASQSSLVVSTVVFFLFVCLFVIDPLDAVDVAVARCVCVWPVVVVVVVLLLSSSCHAQQKPFHQDEKFLTFHLHNQLDYSLFLSPISFFKKK